MHLGQLAKILALANKNSILKVWIGYKKKHTVLSWQQWKVRFRVSSVYTVSPSRNRYLMSTPAPPLSAPPGCWETGSPPAMSHVWQAPFMLAERNPVIWKVMFLEKNTCFDLCIHEMDLNENWPQRTKNTPFVHISCFCIPCRKPVIFVGCFSNLRIVFMHDSKYQIQQSAPCLQLPTRHFHGGCGGRCGGRPIAKTGPSGLTGPLSEGSWNTIIWTRKIEDETSNFHQWFSLFWTIEVGFLFSLAFCAPLKYEKLSWLWYPLPFPQKRVNGHLFHKRLTPNIPKLQSQKISQGHNHWFRGFRGHYMTNPNNATFAG